MKCNLKSFLKMMSAFYYIIVCSHFVLGVCILNGLFIALWMPHVNDNTPKFIVHCDLPMNTTQGYYTEIGHLIYKINATTGVSHAAVGVNVVVLLAHIWIEMFKFTCTESQDAVSAKTLLVVVILQLFIYFIATIPWFMAELFAQEERKYLPTGCTLNWHANWLSILIIALLLICLFVSTCHIIYRRDHICDWDDSCSMMNCFKSTRTCCSRSNKPSHQKQIVIRPDNDIPLWSVPLWKIYDTDQSTKIGHNNSTTSSNFNDQLQSYPHEYI